MIDILVPVLGRPDNAGPLVESIKANTRVEHTVTFLASEKDEAEVAACEATGERVIVMPWQKRGQYPSKMNRGYRETTSPYMLLAADDLDFMPGWDSEALAVAEESGAGVIGTNDCANAEVMQGIFATHPLVRRSYIDTEGGSLDGPGYLIHPGYDHNFSDRELSHLAQFRGKWAFAENCHIVHRHPCWGTAPMDATYKKSLRFMSQDRRLFRHRSYQWGSIGVYPPRRPPRPRHPPMRKP